MIVQALSAMYGAAATWRRRWYARNPARQRRLARPVISVGNLRVGGSGKTPAVQYIARTLLARGERPCVLSRGYKRAKSDAGVTVVSDGRHVLTDPAHAGDEPMLLARALPGVPVLVCADRYEAGTLAEARFAPTLHLLDDGFQHVRLWRDVDLLMVDERDLDDHVLPAGRLREPLANAGVADAVLVTSSDRPAEEVAACLGVGQAFRVTRSLGAATLVATGAALSPAGPVFAIAGIARPERFFDDLRRTGWTLAGTRTFRDHHRFDAADVAAVSEAARASGAEAVVTTEKDAVRLEGLDLASVAFASVPLSTTIEPAEDFAAWLRSRLERARGGQHDGGNAPSSTAPGAEVRR